MKPSKNERSAIRLTKTDIESLKTETVDYFVAVESCHGLNVRIRPDGRKSFVLRYRFNGIQKKRELGKYPAMTPEAAKRAAEMEWAKIYQGIDPNKAKEEARKAAQEARRAAVTLADLAERYIQEHSPDNSAGWRAESTRLIRKHILPALGKLPLAGIGPAEVSNLLFRMKDTPTQANRTRAVLRTMFGRAEEWGMRPLGSNPVAVVKRRALEVKRERRLLDLELKALGASMRESNEPFELKVAVRLALLAGMRKGEILGLRWEWVDLEEGVIIIPARLEDGRSGHKTGRKTGKARVVYLCAALVNDLAMITPTLGNPFVFPGKVSLDDTGPRHLENLQAPWERLREAAGLSKRGEPSEEDPGLHDLRRTFASVGADLGLKGFVAELIGHVEHSVTDIYTRAAAERLKDASEAIGTRIEGILSGAIDPVKEAEVRRVAKAKRHEHAG